MSTPLTAMAALCLALTACAPNAPARPPVALIAVASDQPVVSFRNEMSSSFRLARALFVRDGVVLLNETDPPDEFYLRAGTLGFGDHVLQVRIDLRGEGRLRGYGFTLLSNHPFTLAEDRALNIEVITWEKNNPRLQDHPAIRYVEHVKTISVPRPAQPAEHPETDAAPNAASQPTDESTSPGSVPPEGARPTDAPRQ